MMMMMFVSILIRFRKQPFADAIFYKNIDVIKILELHGAKHPVRIESLFWCLIVSLPVIAIGRFGFLPHYC